MLLTPYGVREWGTITLIAVVVGALAAWLVTAWLVIPVVIVWAAIVSFFRDPMRRLPPGLADGDMLSPADGVITAVERVDHHESTQGPAVIVRMFLSLLDVHVNRAPIDGEVTALAYRPGKFLDARSPECPQVNESNLITLRLASGETMGLRQVSGKVARHIVCRLVVGDRVARGQKFGMIKFGSTAELVLPRPDDVTVHVQVGDPARGGLTVLATLGPSSDVSGGP